ncbi:hypothetical protein CCMA1212_008899 [Trichoderma ghanense]|uniref:DUF866-domain-containing protein n=1 Tax=Trichoderma ghanense TaxID=65468 RepID=A0ABY2GVB5_9HYPO
MFALTLTAELSGVTNLRPDDTQDNPFWYMFKVQCTSCRETHDNYVGVNRFETNEMSGSRGEANFVWRCKNCKRESSATIKSAPAAYEQTEPPKAQKLFEFDCRGLEFVEFKPEGDWLADGIDSGTKFTGIDLTEGEWFDYDEKAGEEVSIKELGVYLPATLNMAAVAANAAANAPAITFLTDAAHLLRLAAPETSAHLLSQRAALLYSNDLTPSDLERQHVCAACGHIMIPGQGTQLKLETLRTSRKKAAGAKASKSRTSLRKTQPPAKPPQRSKDFTCGLCARVTRIPLPAPEPVARQKAAKAKARMQKAAESVEAQKPATANASSKKRAKNRKAGLQALLSGQQRPSNPLSLADFMMK